MISGPMAEFGIRDFVINAFGMDIVEAPGRTHHPALPCDCHGGGSHRGIHHHGYGADEGPPANPINAIITFGYIFSLIFGLLFGYFGHNFIFHGLYIFGLSLMFFGGLRCYCLMALEEGIPCHQP